MYVLYSTLYSTYSTLCLERVSGTVHMDNIAVGRTAVVWLAQALVHSDGWPNPLSICRIAVPSLHAAQPTFMRPGTDMYSM